MKTTNGCSLAATVGSLLMVGLCHRGSIYVNPCYWKNNPHLELPTVLYWKSCQRDCEVQVSLNRHHQWIFDDGEFVGEDLEIGLARRAAIVKATGYRPSIRVRIAAHEPARHFLHLHKASTAVGIEEFSIACFRAEVP